MRFGGREISASSGWMDTKVLRYHDSAQRIVHGTCSFQGLAIQVDLHCTCITGDGFLGYEELPTWRER